MVNSKKLLSLFLAVVMILSTFAVMSFAASEEDDSKVNIKYTVEQVDYVSPEGEDIGAVDNNLYAVTISMKAAKGVMYLQLPIHYNKEHFSIIMDGNWEGNGDGTDTASLGYDGFFADNTYGSIYTYKKVGVSFSDTSMYRANGNTGTANNSVYIGNGAGAAKYTLQVEAVDSTYEVAGENVYAKWTKGLDTSKDGVAFVCFDMTTTKCAFLNTNKNAIVTEWDDIITVYFQRNEGVSEAECVGDVFGLYNDEAGVVLTGWDPEGTTYASTASVGRQVKPGMNLISNAVVEAAAEPTIVNPLKGQMRYGDVVEGAQTYDVRALATITAADFNATFTDEATAKDMIDEIGFVFAAGSNVGTPDMAGVKALVENGTALDGYTKKTVNYLSSGVEADNYVFSCIVTGISETDAQADSLVAVGYIKWTDGEGTHYNYYPQAQTISYATLYNSKPAQA